MAAFHGDTHMQSIMRKLAAQVQPDVVIETGTFHGDSAFEWASFVPHVMSVEIREDNFVRASKVRVERGLNNVMLFQGNSGKLMSRLIAAAEPYPKIVFFLDAHWQDDWPLKDELWAIMNMRAAGKKCVVVVDDFQHPTRPEFYGSHGGGGTVGDPMYGPRLENDSTPCSMETFGKILETFPELWFPCYPGTMPGFVIASDYPLDLVPDAERLH